MRSSINYLFEDMPTLGEVGVGFFKNNLIKIEELVDQYFENAMSDPDAPTITNEITIKLVKEKGDWLIVPDDDLLNAMISNAGKLAEIFWIWSSVCFRED
ncbi:MAG: hypothetical protein WBI44_08480 [Syntrophaceticus sp.]